MQNDVLATGIMSFVMHELVYFGRSLPWMIIDRVQHFNKYKIQNVKSRRQLERCYLKADDLIAKNSHGPGAMELRQACFAVAFYR